MLYSDYDWTDVTPIPQNDGVDALVKINYDVDYDRVSSLLRAIISAAGPAGINGIEQTERVVALTQAILEFNPGHVTAWHCRLVALHKAGATVIPKSRWLLPNFEEIENANFSSDNDGIMIIEDYVWLDAITRRTAKNFQIWHYRQSLAPNRDCALFPELVAAYHLRERAAIKEALAVDSKNYHVWAHFSWLLSTAPGSTKLTVSVTEDLNYTKNLLKTDVLNNSAWAFRHFLVTSCGGQKEVLETEHEYVEAKLESAPQNTSVWDYAEELMRLKIITPSQLRKLAEKHCKRSICARELLMELDFCDGKHKQAEENLVILMELVPVRKGYWDYKRSLMQ